MIDASCSSSALRAARWRRRDGRGSSLPRPGRARSSAAPRRGARDPHVRGECARACRAARECARLSCACACDVGARCAATSATSNPRRRAATRRATRHPPVIPGADAARPKPRCRATPSSRRTECPAAPGGGRRTPSRSADIARAGASPCTSARARALRRARP